MNRPNPPRRPAGSSQMPPQGTPPRPAPSPSSGRMMPVPVSHPMQKQPPRPGGNPPPRRPLTPEEEARRRAYIARKRAEEERMRAEAEARRRQWRTLMAAALVTVLVFVILVLSLQAFIDSRPTGISQVGTGGHVTAPPLSTETEETVTTPEVTTAPPVIPATVRRPQADGNTASVSEKVDSPYVVLISPEEDRIIASREGERVIYPASMTKVMTLLVAYEQITDLDAAFTVTNTIIDPVYKANASLAGFSAGEEVTIRDLLYGTVLPSGAEAALSLAIHVAGSEEEFVKLMNQKAKEMGLENTHFVNCSGLHDKNHVSTPVEIAMILEAAMKHEACAEILSTYTYTTPPTNKHPEGVTMYSTMFTLMTGDEPTDVTIRAGKTGYTPEAGQCLVSYATNDHTGESYILVTAGAKGRYEPVYDAIEMYSEYTK